MNNLDEMNTNNYPKYYSVNLLKNILTMIFFGICR